MTTTGVDKNPYPNSTDTPDGPGAFLALAQRLTKMKGAGIAYAADATALAALITDGDAFTGLNVYHAAADCVVRYNGTAFKLVGRKTFANAAAQTSWTASYSGLIDAGASSFRTDLAIEDRWTGAAWKAWESDWIVYTTTPVSGMVVGTGSSVNSGKYRYEAGMVRAHFLLTLGTVGSSLTGSPILPFPVTALALDTAQPIFPGNASLFDVAPGNAYAAILTGTGGSTSQFRVFLSGTNGLYTAISATSPFTWAAGDSIQGELVYAPA